MEVILTLTLFVAALLVWKVVELNEKIENLEISTRYQLEGVAALLAKLQPKQVKEIPVRLDDEVVNEITEMTKQEMLECQKEKIEFQKKQRKLLKDIMSADEKLGLYDKDDIEEMKIWDATLMDGMDDTQYEGTEYDGGYKINKEQVQEILENIKYRKANRLK
jgi:hypothetical protein